jgi:hypothetical protein
VLSAPWSEEQDGVEGSHRPQIYIPPMWRVLGRWGGWPASAFRPRGVPGPTSKLSPRAPAQMGRRETEREGGNQRETGVKGKPVAFVFVPRLGRVRLQ